MHTETVHLRSSMGPHLPSSVGSLSEHSLFPWRVRSAFERRWLLLRPGRAQAPHARTNGLRSSPAEPACSSSDGRQAGRARAGEAVRPRQRRQGGNRPTDRARLQPSPPPPHRRTSGIRSMYYASACSALVALALPRREHTASASSGRVRESLLYKYGN